MYSELISLSSPSRWLTCRSRGELDDLRHELERRHPEAVVRVIRGGKGRTESAFFDEAAASLQFPSYFGENWNALVDCLGDLRDLHPRPHLILIDQTTRVLADEADYSFGNLIQAVASVAESWSTRSRNGRSPATPLKLILHEDHGHFQILRDRLVGIDATFAEL